jgi:hypothetical protein
MREIEFKGRTGTTWTTTEVGDSNWASFWESVDRQTVAQCTGISDRTTSRSMMEISSATFTTRVRSGGKAVLEIDWKVRDGDRAVLNRHLETWKPGEEFTVVGNTFEPAERRVDPLPWPTTLRRSLGRRTEQNPGGVRRKESR